jgi:hypothetical protein
VKTTGSGVEADGGTWWSFTVTVPTVPADHWKAEYFGNRDLTGAAVATVDEGTGFFDHSWGTGGPAGLSDDFSARFTRTVTFVAGTYRLMSPRWQRSVSPSGRSEFWRQSRGGPGAEAGQTRGHRALFGG